MTSSFRAYTSVRRYFAVPRQNEIRNVRANRCPNPLYSGSNETSVIESPKIKNASWVLASPAMWVRAERERAGIYFGDGPRKQG